MVNWEIFIFISVIFYSISILIQRILLKEQKSDPATYSLVFQLFTGLLILAVGFLIGNMSFPNFSVSIIVSLVAMAILYGLGNIFIFKALKMTEASKFALVFASRAIFTIIASSFLLSEGLTLLQGVGALLILSGVILVTHKTMKFTFQKGDFIALLAAVFFGLAITNDRILLHSFNLYPYVSISFILPALFIMVAYPYTIKKAKIFLNRKTMSKMLILCIMYGIGTTVFYLGLQTSTNSSLVAIINQTSVIVTVLLSIIFLKERGDLYKKIAGTVLCFIGLLLLSL